MQLTRFPRNDIMSLVGEAPRYDLGESVGPDMRLAELLDASGQESLGEMILGYATAEGDPQFRKAIADAHEVHADDVVITHCGRHACVVPSRLYLYELGDEVVTPSPLFPLARNVLAVVGAQVRVLPLSFDQGHQLDPENLHARLSPSTRLVSLASPQNSSGLCFCVGKHGELRCCCDKHGWVCAVNL